MSLRSVLRWLLGIALSLVAHLGIAAALLVSTDPEPVEQETAEMAGIALASMAVPVDAAAPEAPEAESPRAADTRRPAETQGVIPMQRAAPAAAPSTTLAAREARPAALADATPPAPAAPARTPESPTLTAAAAPAAAVAPARPAPVEAVALRARPAPLAARPAAAPALAPVAATATRPVAVTAPAATLTGSLARPVAVLASTPDALPQAGLPPPADPVAVAEPDPVSLAPAAPPAGIEIARAETPGDALTETAPDAAPLAPGTPVTETPAETAPTGEVAPEAAAPAIAAPPATPVTERATATLAWAGAANVRFDPTSLAAVQSFLAPKTATPQGTPRDGITEVLAAEPCARLQAVFVPETGGIELRGHVPDATRRGPLRRKLSAVLGRSIKVTDSIVVLPEPQCNVLAGVAGIGLPQSTGQTDDPFEMGQAAQIGLIGFRDGDRVQFSLEAPDFPAYVYVDYFDAAGNVLHLVPNSLTPLRLWGPRDAVLVGDSIDLIVEPPFGRDIAIAYGSSVPLYESPRPDVEEAGPWIAFLRERVAALRAAGPGFRGEWVYLVIETRP